MLALTTLGGASLSAIPPEAGAQSTVRLAAGKPLALLTYLALAPRRTASREELLTLLWSDADAERALRNLRQTIWQLRNSLGAGALTGTGRDLTLSLALSVDRDDFMTAVEHGDALAAVASYAGPFLPNFALPGADEFERWAEIERARLHRAFTTCGASAVRHLLDDGRLREAQTLARRVRDSEPSHEGHWRLVLETLIAGHESVTALMECGALVAMLATEGVAAEPATKDVLLAVQAMGDAAPGVTSQAAREDASLHFSSALRGELVGRQHEFATLLATWRRAQGGPLQHVHVAAPAGIGKSRLLQDIAARLRAKGATVITLRARISERAIPYSVAADLAAALGETPGAAGISAQAAHTLGPLAPQLAPRATSADPGNGSADVLRRRVAALTDLWEAVTDEQPVALLIDDLHWADPTSLQILRAVLDRGEGSHCLVVTAARNSGVGAALIAATQTIALSPLLASDVHSFVSSVAALPADPWSERFVGGLHAASGGSPLLVLETLKLALEHGCLQCVDGRWVCTDEAALRGFLQAGNAIRRRLGGLEDDERTVLLTLAAAATPADSGLIAGALRKGAGDAMRALVSLERRGIIEAVGDKWQIVHDEIAHTSLDLAPAETLATVHQDLAHTLLARGNGGTTLRRAAYHCLKCNDALGHAKAYRRWVQEALERGERASARTLAEALSGTDASRSQVEALVSSLPVTYRIRLRAGVSRAVVGAAAIAAVTGCAMLFQYDHRPRYAALADGPMAMASWVPLAPAPVVELRDREGRRATSASDSVHVGIRGVTGHLRGTLAVRAVNGRATFTDLVYDGPSARMPQLVFTVAGMAPVVAAPLNVDHSDRLSSLAFVEAQLNGQTLAAQHRVLEVAPGADIAGTVTFRYTSAWPAASVVLGVVPTWGDKRTSWHAIGPMVTPVRRAIRTNPLSLRAPATRGIYRLWFVFQAEDGVQFVASGTSWKVGHPIWDDGNDVADWTSAQAVEANVTGHVRSILVEPHGERVPYYVPAAEVTVMVGGRTRARESTSGEAMPR